MQSSPFSMLTKYHAILTSPEYLYSLMLLILQRLLLVPCYINICYIDILNIFSDTTHTVSQVKHSASTDGNFLCGRLNQYALLPGNLYEKGVLKISQNSQENSFHFVNVEHLDDL